MRQIELKCLANARAWAVDVTEMKNIRKKQRKIEIFFKMYDRRDRRLWVKKSRLSSFITIPAKVSY